MRRTIVRIAAGLGLGLAVLAGVVVWNTVRFDRRISAVPEVPLADRIDIDAGRAAARLGEAIRIETISTQNPAETRWENWDRLHAWMRATYPAAHAAMQVERVAGHALIYVWSGSDPAAEPIVLMAHQDVVPVEPGTEGAWTHPPFSGAIADGFVWGRGALDDKGSLIALMEAAEVLAEQGFKPRRTVYFVFGHDEEVLGSGAQQAADWFRRKGIRPWFALDEGGVIIHEGPFGDTPLAVIQVAEKGYATLRVTTTAEGGHSSMPPNETAVHTLAKAVDRIASDPYPVRFEGPGAETVGAAVADAPWIQRALIANAWLFEPLIAAELSGSPALAALFRTTTAPTVLEGSPKENVLPQRASALINFRIHPRDTPDQVMARARRQVGDLPVQLAWEGATRGATPVSSSDSDAFRLLAALAVAENEGVRPSAGLMSGAADARQFDGVAKDVYRFSPIVLDEADLPLFHGTNERISIANLERMSEYFARLIVTAAR
jgi:carboxypeptidase PM20D1